MLEIERKLRFPGIVINTLVERLADGGFEFAATLQQRDVVFAASAADVARPRDGTIIARVREQPHEISMTVKVRAGGDLVRQETNLVVDSAESAQEMLRSLGFHEVVAVSKARLTTRVNPVREADRPEVHVVVDDVGGLGVFVELEVLADASSAARDLAQRALDSMQLSIERLMHIQAEVVDKGYDRLLLEERGGSPRA